MAKQKTRTKDYTAPDIAALEAEKSKLYISGDKKRLEQVKSILNYIYYGIK